MIKPKRVAKNQRQKNRKLLHKLKINGCAICGYNKCDRGLDFHHVNPEDKKFCINQTQMSNKNLLSELEKCILLCKNCHAEITQKEKGYDKTSI